MYAIVLGKRSLGRPWLCIIIVAMWDVFLCVNAKRPTQCCYIGHLCCIVLDIEYWNANKHGDSGVD